MRSVIYDFLNYRDYLKALAASQDGGGRGFKSQIAGALGISSSMISAILSGKKSMNQEQASDLADFLGLKDQEAEFLFLMVDHDRAGHHRLKERIQKRIDQERVRAQKISERVKKDKELSEEEKSIFYSSWIYSGVRILTSTSEFKSASDIAKRLNLPHATVNKVVEFLLAHNLCIEKNGRIDMGPAYTHIDADSPFANKHRQNWRVKAIQKMDQQNDNDLFYVCPMSLSVKDAVRVRAILVNVIEEILGIMKPSPSEQAQCLNIDWFEYS